MGEIPTRTISSRHNEDLYEVEVSLYGAQVISFRNVRTGSEMLFKSRRAKYDPPKKAFRGGIPICFPQFSDFGSMSRQHGFARNSMFEVEEEKVDSPGDSITLRLEHVPNGMFWDEFPHEFVLKISIWVVPYKDSAKLFQKATVLNTGKSDLDFSFAFHTYYNLKNGIENAGIHNLIGTNYLDSLKDRKLLTENEEIVTFKDGEVDRIYLDVQDKLTILDGKDRCIEILKENSLQDCIIWNPHIEKSARMDDFGDDEWQGMVCVEIGQAGSGCITLEPSSEWWGLQCITFSEII